MTSISNIPIRSFILLSMNFDMINSSELDESFVTTYSSLQSILSQMQMKLAGIFLQETDYLQKREQELEHNDEILQENIKSLQEIQIEREELEKEFIQLQHRLETAIVHVIDFQTNGIEILRVLFSESHQIDEEISSLFCQCLSSLTRSRTMIHSKIEQFSHQSQQIHSFLTEQEQSLSNSRSILPEFFELVQQFNQINLEHSNEIHLSNIDFENQSHFLIDRLPSNENLRNELVDIHRLENCKQQLEKELLEQTILLENISTIIGLSID